MEQEDIIIGNLDRFIRKYYKSRLIRGALYCLAALLTLFIALVLLEHFGYFSTAVRTLLFWLYVAATAALLAAYVASPLLKMRGLGRRISRQEAARIVGRHFPEVKDSLLNLLQLQQGEAATPSARLPLLQAAIEQKTAQLRPVPFVNAVDLRVNRKYVKYAAIPALLIALALLVAPSFVTGPSQRLLHHATPYERPAPFDFIVLNDSLQAERGADFSLQVEARGVALPNEMYVDIEGHPYRMQRQGKARFAYLFSNLRHDTEFALRAAGFSSRAHRIEVYASPEVTEFAVALHYPPYTGKADEVVSNLGDLSVPQGTVAQWRFRTDGADTLRFLQRVADDPAAPYAALSLLPAEDGTATHALRVMGSVQYAFCASSRRVPARDTLRYTLSAIADAPPLITALEARDSLAPQRVFFKGRIKDDYGFSRLLFHFARANAADTARRVTTQPLPLDGTSAQEFYFSINLEEMDLRPGDEATYYFQVWDNDALHGPKAATSQTFSLRLPTTQEMEEHINDNAQQINAQADRSLSELRSLQQDINELTQRLANKKELDWQDKQQLQQLAKKQREVKERMQQMQRQMQENNSLEERYRQQSEELMQKQDELDRLMEEVLTDEMKRMMDEMERLMQQIDKNKVQEQLQELKGSSEELSKRLDQNIELMRRLELEKRVEDAIQRTDTLAQRQKELAEETQRAKEPQEALERKQDALNEDYQRLRRDLDEIQQGYKRLDNPEQFDRDQQLEQRIQQSQREASQQLQKGKNGKASQQQQQAGEEMERLSQQLREEQQQMEQQSLAEDSEEIRRLLNSLVRLSFSQEGLMGDAQRVHIQDPQYQTLIADQNKVKTDFRSVHDSLSAVAKRQMAVASAIGKELAAANGGIERSLNDLLRLNQTFYGRSRNAQAATSMQYTMTAFNNLALVLVESLDQMQNQMRRNQQQKGNKQCNNPGMRMQGQCSNPGGAKPSPKSMKEMQDALNKQMEALRKQLQKQGTQPTRSKIGQKNGISEEFARMAAQQEQIRRMMQQYGQEMKQSQPGNAKLAKEIEQLMRQMEQTETDLVNRTITSQTMRRQQQIMTRLLEHEKADLKQQQEQRRQSKEAQDMPQPSPPDLPLYNKLREKSMEQFRTAPPSLTPYYKQKVNDYFYRFGM